MTVNRTDDSNGERHADPLLLGLARAGYDDVPGLRLVSRDLCDPGWLDALDLDRSPDAFISTTALHWLTRGRLRAVYAACVRALCPGGILINGDHMAGAPARPRLDALTSARRAAAGRAGGALGRRGLAGVMARGRVSARAR